jgi:hypothetical protein
MKNYIINDNNYQYSRVVDAIYRSYRSVQSVTNHRAESKNLIKNVSSSSEGAYMPSEDEQSESFKCVAQKLKIPVSQTRSQSELGSGAAVN